MLKRLFQPWTQSTSTSIGFFLLRLVAGLAMMFHGFGKMQAPMSWMGPESPVPGIFQFLAAFSEFGGGLAWILGLLMPLASFGMACTMVVATLLHAVMLKDPFVASSKGGGSYELALVYLIVSILFLLAGPGKLSLDTKIFGEKK